MEEKLRDFDDNILTLLQMLDEGEIDEQTVRDTIEGEFKDGLAQKADNYGTVMSHLDAEAEMLSKEIERLKTRKDKINNDKDRMKSYLQTAVKHYLEASGEKNLKGQYYTFGIKKNPAALKITDEAKVPFEYMIPQAPKIDKETIKKELKAGKKFEFAVLEQGESLTIK